jgi:hypothetical protein
MPRPQEAKGDFAGIPARETYAQKFTISNFLD